MAEEAVLFTQILSELLAVILMHFYWIVLFFLYSYLLIFQKNMVRLYFTSYYFNCLFLICRIFGSFRRLVLKKLLYMFYPQEKQTEKALIEQKALKAICIPLFWFCNLYFMKHFSVNSSVQKKSKASLHLLNLAWLSLHIRVIRDCFSFDILQKLSF